MRKPTFGEANLGAVIGAVIGAVGGLFAVTIPGAIMWHNIHILSMARQQGLLGFLVCTPVGWIIGGQLAARMEAKLGERAAGIIGGIIGGMLPVGGFLYWGWRIVHG